MARTEVVAITNMCMVLSFYYKTKLMMIIVESKTGQMMTVQDIWYYSTKPINFKERCLHLRKETFVGLKWKRKMNLADRMDKMLEIFLDERISEYFFYEENAEWKEELKECKFGFVGMNDVF